MNLSRLIDVLEPSSVINEGPRDVQIRDLAYDTRAVQPATAFFCVPGKRVDGHELAAAAADAGAAALVVERAVDVALPQLVVDSVRVAMPRAAADFFEQPSNRLPVAAITGTNGKTTTAFLLHSVLSAAGQRPALLTNVERRIGGATLGVDLNTPEAIDLQRLLRRMLDSGDGACVMEATSIASSQHRLDCTRFAVLVFTNLTQDHLDFHDTMEQYYAAKRALFAQAACAVVNVADQWGKRLADELPDAIAYTPDDSLDGIDVKLVGRFNRANAVAAVTAARSLGVAEDAIRAGISAVNGVPGRFELIDEGQPFVVVVDYAHTPDSLESALVAAQDIGGGRTIVVFGAGGDRDRDKRPLMGRVAAARADRAIVTTDNPRHEQPASIAAEIVAGAPDRLEMILDRREAITTAIGEARAGDVVLIAGKGADTEMELADERVPFDDRVVARDVIRRVAVA